MPSKFNVGAGMFGAETCWSWTASSGLSLWWTGSIGFSFASPSPRDSMGNGFMSRSGGEVSLWYEAPTITLLPGGGSFPAGLTGGPSMALPKTLGDKAKTVFGRSSAAFEILATWARLEGTKTATAVRRTVTEMRIPRVRFAIRDPPICRGLGQTYSCRRGPVKEILRELSAEGLGPVAVGGPRRRGAHGAALTLLWGTVCVDHGGKDSPRR